MKLPRELIGRLVQRWWLLVGCFLHGCPEHRTWPKANAEWWRAKIEANRRRDEDTDRRLQDAGWTVVHAWAHEDPEDIAVRVVEELERGRTERQ
jgi:DNA mismatch endonuclease (patch repair protein)